MVSLFMTTKKLTIISPIYNEEKNLIIFFSVLKNTIEQFKKNFLIEVIFVNDGSTDNSLRVCQQIKKDNSFVNIISLTRNFGHQNAILSALKTISSDLYLVLDSDLQQDPKNIKTILNLLKNLNSNLK